MDGAMAIGVVDYTGDAPQVAYLERPTAPTSELLAMARPLKPTEIFRFAAPCQAEACSHWSEGKCKLATRVVQLIPVASTSLPRCHIRTQCRWYSQEGRVACERCPHIATQNESPSDVMREAATPK